MLGAREELVFCAELKISKSAGFVLVLWIQVHELFAQFDAEIRRNPFGDIHCDRGLASLCCFDRRDGGKRQFIVHERIIGRKCCWKKTRAGKTVSSCGKGQRELTTNNINTAALLKNFISSTNQKALL